MGIIVKIRYIVKSRPSYSQANESMGILIETWFLGFCRLHTEKKLLYKFKLSGWKRLLMDILLETMGAIQFSKKIYLAHRNFTVFLKFVFNFV